MTSLPLLDASPSTALSRLAAKVVASTRVEPMVRLGGKVAMLTPAFFRVSGLSRHVTLGDRIAIESADGPKIAEIVRIDAEGATAKPYDDVIDARIGTPAWRIDPLTLWPHADWKGRVINALGEPVDGRGTLTLGNCASFPQAPPLSAMARARTGGHMRTGIRVIDIFTPLCAGQRIGIFAGSGVGKSTLLAMLANAEQFDTVVICLVGERGREVREFLEETLGEQRARAVMVVSTSDESPMMRRLAPRTALAVGEYFRDQGDRVLMIIDSITRYAHAARDVALASGEPAVSRGFPPSVFSDLPKLLERAGPGLEGGGSITGIFSVLVDGDDHNDPVADNVRGILDGHIVLERSIADRGRYPAVNPLTSISRLARHGWSAEEAGLVRKLLALIARFEETRDLRLMGGYQAGNDPDLDMAVRLVPGIYDAIRQDLRSPRSENAFRDLAQILKTAAG
jgi:flagellum-specific ATP synthase